MLALGSTCTIDGSPARVVAVGEVHRDGSPVPQALLRLEGTTVLVRLTGNALYRLEES